MKKKIFISAYPYCLTNQAPIKILNENDFEFTVNNKKRRLTELEIKKILPHYDGLIADTEPLTEKVLKNCNKLKIISRVGIGLNSVDLNFAKKKNIKVTHTPDAPTMAVVELTIGLILNALRRISDCNNNLKSGIWKRYLGRRISEVKIGIIGFGRIGSKVANLLFKMGAKKIFYNDLMKKKINKNIIFKSKKFLYKNCDILSLHIPLNKKTKNIINKKAMSQFKKNIILINTARGEVVCENELIKFLSKNRLSYAASDVFSKEPYRGKLLKQRNCLLTPHIGSMTNDCREKMELEATENLVNFFLNKTVKNLVC